MTITTRGIVCTDPQYDNGLLRFRFAQPFADELTPANWFTVIARDEFAEYLTKQVRKGDRLIVVGTLRVRDWDNGERCGTLMEIHADTMGHDLAHYEKGAN